MKKHIPFGGMTTTPTDHEGHEGDCALSINLIHEDEALRPIGIVMEHTGKTINGTLCFIHQTERYKHLIYATNSHENGDENNEVETDESEIYYWQDVEGEGTSRELLSGIHVNEFASMGDTLCLSTDTEMLYAIWQPEKEGYLIVRHEDLLYELTLTQDNQVRVEVSQTITPTLARYLDAPDTALTSRNALPAQVFPGFYATEDAVATGATMVAAQMEVLLDQEASRRGIGCMRHVVFGMAALRLKDGSTIMHSNPFALWSSELTTTLTADRENNILRMSAYLHRHTITVRFRKADSSAMQLIDGIEIFLTRPLNFLDMHKAAGHTTDGAGLTTSLTFGHLDRQAVTDLLRQMTFHHALILGVSQLATPILLPSATNGEAADLHDLRRTTEAARTIYSHGGRLHLSSTTTVLHNPMEIPIRYTYHTLDAATRLALSPTQQAEALHGELTAGFRADINDNADGQEAELVVRAVTDDTETKEVWWKATVQYPIPGMMMYPNPHIREMEWHVKLSNGVGFRYFSLRQRLDIYDDKGMSAAVYGSTGQAHLTHRPVLHFLLLQQVESLVYDSDSGTYIPSYPIWQSESAADYEAQAEKARERWPLRRNQSRLRTSKAGNPFVFPNESSIDIGGGELHGILSNTRRTADGLYGDGQYYAFTTEGVWLLRLSGGKWHAQQAVTRMPPLGIQQVVCTHDAVVYLSSTGVMMLKGSKVSCLSEELQGRPFNPAMLPRFDDILATEPSLSCLSPCDDWRTFLQTARMFYDVRQDRLCLWNTPVDEEGRQRWPFLLVRSMRGGAWATASLALQSIISCGETIMGVDSEGSLVGIGCDVHLRQPFVCCTRPLSFGERHVPKAVERLIVRGLFLHRGSHGSHVGVALWGSNDLHHWHLIGTSADQYLHRRRGIPYKWFRLLVIGQILPGESIEGCSFIAKA